MQKSAAVPVTGDAVELLARALSEGRSVTLAIAKPPRVVRPQPVIICCRKFDLTASPARLLLALVEHGCVAKADLHHAMSRDGRVVSSIKTVDVVVTKVRQKLAPYGIEIITVWGEGYMLANSDRDKIRGMLAEATDDKDTKFET